jgi:hypothetical protein
MVVRGEEEMPAPRQTRTARCGDWGGGWLDSLK